MAATTRGGAGRGLLGVHNGLASLGIESHIVSTDPRQVTDHGTIIGAPAPWRWVSRVSGRLNRVILQIAGGNAQETFHFPIIPSALPRLIGRLQPDVVHVHWTGGYLTPRQIRQLALRYPTVWTLRDMSPITGGCHYTHGCTAYELQCRCCPLLERSSDYDPTYWLHRWKSQTFRNIPITLIAISSWMRDQAARSSLFHGRSIDVIHPGVDTTVFKPTSQASARLEFGLSQSHTIVGFAALRPFSDSRKGAHILNEALLMLADPSVHAAVTCAPADVPQEAQSRWIPVGKIESDEALAGFYSACDILVVPSTEEAFGKVVTEAMSCGTRVVTFQNVGAADVVTHLDDGYIARSNDVDDLARGIAWATSERLSVRQRQEVHDRVTVRFGLESQARRYQQIYSAALDPSPPHGR